MEYEAVRDMRLNLRKGSEQMLSEIAHFEGRPVEEILEEYISKRYLYLFGRERAKRRQKKKEVEK